MSAGREANANRPSGPVMVFASSRSYLLNSCTLAPICGMPLPSATDPSRLPVTGRERSAACAVEAPKTRNPDIAMALTKLIRSKPDFKMPFRVRPGKTPGFLRCYRKLGRRSKALVLELVHDLQLQRILPRRQRLQRQLLLHRHQESRSVRNRLDILRLAHHRLVIGVYHVIVNRGLRLPRFFVHPEVV